MPEDGEIQEQGKVEGQQQERVPPAGEQQRAQKPGSAEEVLEDEYNLPPLYQRGDDPEFDRLMDNVKAADLLRPSRDDFDNDGEYELAFLQWQLAKAEARLAMGDYKTKKGEAGIDDQGRNPEQRRADRLSHIESLKKQIIEQEIDNAKETVEAPTQEAHDPRTMSKEEWVESQVDTPPGTIDRVESSEGLVFHIDNNGDRWIKGFHGSPDFVGEKFDRKFLGRNVGLSRGGFSFAPDKRTAESYATITNDDTQIYVDAANDLTSEIAKRDPNFELKDQFGGEVAAREYQSGLVDDVQDLFEDLRTIADVVRPTMPDIADRLLDVENIQSREANPKVIEAWIKNPDIVDVHGKKAIIAKDPNQIVEVKTSEQLEAEWDAAQQAPTQEAPKQAPIQERVDIAGLEQAMRDDKTEEVPPEPPPIQEGNTVGISKAWDKLWGGLRNQKLLNPDVEAHETVLKEAFAQGQYLNADKIIAKIDKQKPITKHEVAGILIRKTQVFAEIQKLSKQIAESSDDAVTGQLINDQQALIAIGEELTSGIRKAGTEIGRAASMFAVELDKDTFDIVNVISRYKATKGSDLTPEETARITEKVEERQEIEDDLANMEYTGNPLIDGMLIMDEVRRIYRRMKKKGRKRIDVNADKKLLRSRQDKIFNLIDEINNGRPKSEQIKKVQNPDQYGFLEMIELLDTELKRQKETVRKVEQNIKLIDKRDALLAEIENMHRDIGKQAETLKKSKLQKDIDQYNQAKRDQDTIAELLSELRGDIKSKTFVTKEDVYGYKQTIKNLRQKISDKKLIEQLDAEIAVMEQAIGEGDFRLTEQEQKSQKDFINKEIELRKAQRREMQSKLRKMKADRDKLDRIESQAVELLDQLENAHRAIRAKKKAGQDPNADLKLALRRQDTLFKIIDEINNGRPKQEKVQKVEQPDTEGYLEMIQVVREELQKVRRVRSLDEKIAQLEKDIDAGNIEKYDKPKTKEDDPAIILKLARIKALGSEINRQIAASKPMTPLGKLRFYIWDPLRNVKLAIDAGHILRQGAFLVSNPRTWKNGDTKKFFVDSFKSFNEQKANEIDAQIMSHEWYSFWKAAGAPFIEEGMQLDAREEILSSGLMSRIPGFKHSGRAQLTGTNVLRLLMLESYRGGREISMEEGRRIVQAVSILSGRGATVSDPKVNRALNALLTSPSFTASRLQTPFILMHKDDQGNMLWKDKNLRNRVLEDYSFFIGTRLAIMGALAAAIPGVEIGDDVEHWTYGRLIVDLGNGYSRVYDPWAGVASAYRALYPIVHDIDLPESLKKLAEGRLHPAITSIVGVAKGETYYGEEIDRRAAALSAILPISVDGMREAIEKDTGVFDLLAAVSADVMGIGSTLVETSDLRKSRQKAKKNN